MRLMYFAHSHGQTIAQTYIEHRGSIVGKTVAWIGDGTPSPWLAKSSLKKGAPLVAATQDPNNANVYWGYLPECSDLTAAQRETNPCISLLTKQAATLRAAVVPNIMSASDFTTLGMKDADIAIVISKPFPWDGKMGLK